MKITLVTMCKGRLAHLRRTLPGNICQPESKCLVVDFDCPQNTKDWVKTKFPQVDVVHVVGRPFNFSEARNAGMRQVTTPWIASVDADAYIRKSLIDVCDLSDPMRAYVLKVRGADSAGFVVVSKHAYDLVGGYDERYRDYGYEDPDFLVALLDKGVTIKTLDNSLIDFIKHTDEERATYFTAPIHATHHRNQKQFFDKWGDKVKPWQELK